MKLTFWNGALIFLIGGAIGAVGSRLYYDDKYYTEFYENEKKAGGEDSEKQTTVVVEEEAELKIVVERGPKEEKIEVEKKNNEEAKYKDYSARYVSDMTVEEEEDDEDQPYFIDAKTFAEESEEYEKISLIYIRGLDELRDENDEIIRGRELFLCEGALDRLTKKNTEIYIRNPIFMADYEIRLII